jgi:hypothetical protein
MLQYKQPYIELVVNAGFPIKNMVDQKPFDGLTSIAGGNAAQKTAPFSDLVIPMGLHYNNHNSHQKETTTYENPALIDDALFDKMFSQIAIVHEKKTPRKTMKNKK